MSKVLLISGDSPKMSVLHAAVDQIRSRGAQVFLAGAMAADQLEPELGLDGLYAMPADIARAKPTRKAAKAPPGERVWLRVSKDASVRRCAREADVIVALDGNAVYTVWRFAQRYRSAAAVYGLNAARVAVEGAASAGAAGLYSRAFAALPSPALAVQTLRRMYHSALPALARLITFRPLMRSRLGMGLWLAVTKAPRIPDRWRVKIARLAADGMAWGENYSGEMLIFRAAASRMRHSHHSANLLNRAATRELKRGAAPHYLTDALNALLSVADHRYESGQQASGAIFLRRALTLAFHRILHIDRLDSPLVADPAEFMKPFWSSLVGKRLRTPAGREEPAAGIPKDRPLRLLITTSTNANFLHLIRSHYEAHPDVDARFLDLAEESALRSLTWAFGPMVEHHLGGGSAYADKIEEALRPYLDWADVVFIEWCVAPAALFTMIDPGTTRVIVRLHSYETLSRWPHLVDFSRVDDVVFVAPHIRDLACRILPQIQEPPAPRLSVIENGLDLRNFQIDKEPEARFHIGVVGISQVAKDPRWAVEVFRRLLARDQRYRLIMVGPDMSAETSVATRDYLEAFEQDVAELEAAGVVLRTGPTNDVPKALTRVGVILSSSVREGSPCGVLEAAASGAVPVVRDWPFFAGQPNGARTLYPADWVVASHEEAVDRILKVTESEEIWRSVSSRVASEAVANADWATVKASFDKLILQSGP